MTIAPEGSSSPGIQPDWRRVLADFSQATSLCNCLSKGIGYEEACGTSAGAMQYAMNLGPIVTAMLRRTSALCRPILTAMTAGLLLSKIAGMSFTRRHPSPQVSPTMSMN